MRDEFNSKNGTDFNSAAFSGDFKTVQNLIRRVGQKAKDQALWHATIQDYPAIRQFLLENGANRQAELDARLHLFSVAGDVQGIRDIVQEGADLHNKDAASSLFAAAYNGQIGAVRDLLDRGVDPHEAFPPHSRRLLRDHDRDDPFLMEIIQYALGIKPGENGSAKCPFEESAKSGFFSRGQTREETAEGISMRAKNMRMARNERYEKAKEDALNPKPKSFWRFWDLS